MLAFAGLSLAVCIAGVPAGAGGQDQPVPSFAARTQRVVVDVVVTDRDGVPVTGLMESDFEVSEDGERQRVASFEAITTAPRPANAREGEATPSPAPGLAPGRLYVVAFDDVNLTPYKVHEAKAAVASFVRSLGPDDRVLLFSTSSGERRLSDSADSRGAVLDMLRGLSAGHLPDMSPDRMSDYEAMMIHVLRDRDTEDRVTGRVGSRMGIATGQSTAALAAEAYGRAAGRIRDTLRALLALIDSMAAESGRKSIILVTEGFVLAPDITEFKRLTQAAMRANAAFYFVDARKMVLGASEYPIERNEMGGGLVAVPLAEQAGEVFGAHTLATDTGGFSIRDTNDLAAGMQRIAAETRTYYLIGYDPTKEPDGRFRKIRVKVSRKGLRVRARKGYFAEVRPAPSR